MPDIVVDTDALRTTASHLRVVTQAAVDLGGRSGLAMSYVPSVGLAGPAQALDSFEAQLCRQIRNPGSAAPPVPVIRSTPMPEPTRPAPVAAWGLLASATAPVEPQLATRGTHASWSRAIPSGSWTSPASSPTSSRR